MTYTVYTVLLISCEGSLDGSRATVVANGDIDAIYKANESWGTSVLWPTELYAVISEEGGRARFYRADENRLLYRTHEVA